MPIQTCTLASNLLGSLEVITAQQISHTISRHLHDSLCIIIIQQGSCYYKISQEKYILHAGQILIIHPGEVHTCQSINGQAYDYTVICLKSLQVLTEKLFPTSPNASSINTTIRFSRLLSAENFLFDKFVYFSHLCQENASLLEIEATGLICFSLWITKHSTYQYGNHCSPPKTTELTKKVYDYIKAHYTEDLSLQQLSDLFYISPYHLTRCFTKHFGFPPHICQNLFRIKQAKHLLKKGGSLSYVAAETGFSDQSHLTRRFKNIVGMTPGQWKKSHQKNIPPAT